MPLKGYKKTVDHIKPFALYPELRFAKDNGRTLNTNKFILIILLFPFLANAKVLLSPAETSLINSVKTKQVINRTETKSFLSLLSKNFGGKKTDISKCKGTILERLTDKLLGNC